VMKDECMMIADVAVCVYVFCYFCIVCVEPNDESGANIEASKMWRTDRAQFDAIVRKQVMESLGL
jgi:ubiquitin-protein ligase